MGGGGAMKAAAKIATAASTIRTVAPTATATSVPLPDHVIAKATRKMSTSILSKSGDDWKGTMVVQGGGGIHPVWSGIDEWEFSGGVEEKGEDFVVDSVGSGKERVVFGSVPSLDEAKEATSELKDAIEKVYFDPNNKDSSEVIQHSAMSTTLCSSGYLETKACVSSETTVVQPTVSNSVLQAFSMLKGSPQAQSVVASLVSDKNVWDAVLKNEQLMEFIKLQQVGDLPSNEDLDVNADKKLQDDHKLMVSKEGEQTESDFGSVFTNFMQQVKFSVEKMVSTLSGFFQDIFGGLADGDVKIDPNGSATIAEKAVGASLMGLAILAILVVLLKRA